MIHFYKKPNMYRTLCGITYEQVKTNWRAPIGIVVPSAQSGFWADSVAWDVDDPSNMVDALMHSYTHDKSEYVHIDKRSIFCKSCRASKLFQGAIRNYLLEMELSR